MSHVPGTCNYHVPGFFMEKNQFYWMKKFTALTLYRRQNLHKMTGLMKTMSKICCNVSSQPVPPHMLQTDRTFKNFTAFNYKFHKISEKRMHCPENPRPGRHLFKGSSYMCHVLMFNHRNKRIG
jgi:hypothetical protein